MANRLFVQNNYLYYVENFSEPNERSYDVPLGGIYRELSGVDSYVLVKANLLTRNSLQFPYSGKKISLIQDDLSTLQDENGSNFSSSSLLTFLNQNTGGFRRGSGGAGAKEIFTPTRNRLLRA